MNNSQPKHQRLTNDSKTKPKQVAATNAHTNSQDVRMAALDQRAAEAWLHLNPDPQVPLPAFELGGKARIEIPARLGVVGAMDHDDFLGEVLSDTDLDGQVG